MVSSVRYAKVVPLRLNSIAYAGSGDAVAVSGWGGGVFGSMSRGIVEADPVECFDLLLADDADIAVVVATPSLPPTVDPRFDQQPLLDDPLKLLVPAGQPALGAAARGR
jgi:hypothetical protein